MEKERESYRAEWGERQVSMCAKSKMELEKRRGSREQGVQGNLSHTLTHTHTHTHGRCSACADRKKIQRNHPSAWEQRIQVKWPRGHSDRRLVTHRYTHTHTHTHNLSLRIHTQDQGGFQNRLRDWAATHSHPAECWLNRGADANRSVNEHRSKDPNGRGQGRGDWAPVSHSVSHTHTCQGRSHLGRA